MNLVTDRARSLRRHAKAMLKLRPRPEVLPASVQALALVQALRTLPIRQRQVLVLHFLVDLPVEEVADTLGMPNGTVKSCPAAGTRWRSSLARRSRCSIPRGRPARATCATVPPHSRRLRSPRSRRPPQLDNHSDQSHGSSPELGPLGHPTAGQGMTRAFPGPDPGRIVGDVTSLVRGCQGTSRVRLWANARSRPQLLNGPDHRRLVHAGWR
jgi:Sigma-70, region 4